MPRDERESVILPVGLLIALISNRKDGDQDLGDTAVIHFKHLEVQVPVSDFGLFAFIGYPVEQAYDHAGEGVVVVIGQGDTDSGSYVVEGGLPVDDKGGLVTSFDLGFLFVIFVLEVADDLQIGRASCRVSL